MKKPFEIQVVVGGESSTLRETSLYVKLCDARLLSAIEAFASEKKTEVSSPYKLEDDCPIYWIEFSRPALTLQDELTQLLLKEYQELMDSKK